MMMAREVKFAYKKKSDMTSPREGADTFILYPRKEQPGSRAHGLRTVTGPEGEDGCHCSQPDSLAFGVASLDVDILTFCEKK